MGDKCPALSAISLKCHKKGHYSAKCFTKGPASAHELSVDTAFLGAMTTVKSASVWYITICIGDRDFIQTGHRGKSDRHHGRCLQETPMNGAAEAIKGTHGPAHQALDVQGQFTATLELGGHSTTQTVYVVQGLRSNLLGFPVITALQLLCAVDATETDEWKSGKDSRCLSRSRQPGRGV